MRTFDFFLVKEECDVSRFSCSSWDWVNEGFSWALRLRHPFVLRCNGSAASSSVPRYAAPMSPLRATLQRQRCVFVGASLRCTYVTPSRYAATAALRLRRCLTTLHLRHPFALRCNGSAASSSVAHYAAPTSPLRATLQRQRCVTSAVLQRCSALRRGWIPIKEWIEGQLGEMG